MRIISREEYDLAFDWLEVFSASGIPDHKCQEETYNFIANCKWEDLVKHDYSNYVDHMQQYMTKLNKYLTSTEET